MVGFFCPKSIVLSGMKAGFTLGNLVEGGIASLTTHNRAQSGPVQDEVALYIL